MIMQSHYTKVQPKNHYFFRNTF